jgi:single-strand DNA-binding protein
MYLPTVHGEFRAAADPTIRFTPSSKAVASLRAVASKQKKNDAGEWVDDKECWVNITIWDQPAENVVESISQGDLFFVSGRLETRPWEDKDGNKRISVDITADHIGPSLARASAKVTKNERRAPGQPQQQADTGGGAAQGSDDPPF